jgi:hypothetical protein
MSSKAVTILLLSVMLSSTIASKDTIVIDTKKIKNGFGRNDYEYKYFYDKYVPDVCETIFIFGVGTDMNVHDYNELGRTISVGNRIVTLVSDSTSGLPMKLRSHPWKRYYHTIVKIIKDKNLIPVCANTTDPNILFGGHSASAQGILNALPKLKPQPDGLIFLSPFKIIKSMKIDKSIPTLNWGFEDTTCKVDVNAEAKAAYELTSPDHRVLYKINNTNTTIKHCSFTDAGCKVLGIDLFCSKGNESEWVIPAVSESIQIFADNIVKGRKPTKTQYELDVVKNRKTVLYVNEKSPNDKNTCKADDNTCVAAT